MADITITHTHEDGTTLTGSTKGDGVYEIALANGFRWGRYAGIYIRGSRDRDARTRTIDACADALRAAGHTVTTDVDNTARTAAVRAEDRAARVDARVGRLDERAGKAAAEADARVDAAHRLTDGIPFGQPVQPVGHHSRAGHLRSLDRADNHMRKSCEADAKARRLADRAEGAARNEAHKNNPRAMARRIETLQVEARGIARKLEGYERKSTNGRGEVIYVEKHAAASGEWAERLTRRAEVIAEEVAWLRGRLDELADTGEFVAWSREYFAKGDQARIGGRWYEVTRVNAKSVSLAGNMWPHTMTWDGISGRRRDGQQWDTPNGAPWPVELARKVARWRGLTASADRADQHSWSSPERSAAMTAAGHVADARRIVHGLDLDTSDAEVRAVVDSITGIDACRDLCGRYVAVFDRLAAGESYTDVAAGTTAITGAPEWQSPAGVDPEDRRAGPGWPQIDSIRLVAVGDLVAGVYDKTHTGRVLLREFSGPVAAVSDVTDRREVGEFVTVTLTDGTEKTLSTTQWLGVWPAGTWETLTKEPAESASPSVISGPHAPSTTVRRCDVGGEMLPGDSGWWLVRASGRGWASDTGAACAAHAGRPVAAMPSRTGAPRDGYTRATEAAATQPDEDEGGTVTAVTGAYVRHNGRRLRIVFAPDRRDLLHAYVDDQLAYEIPGGLAELMSNSTLDALCEHADQGATSPEAPTGPFESWADAYNTLIGAGR